ncbi:hypothetical protein RB195_020947 [Necator americanus]|uniref:Nucleotide-diphospho-sugar transferase domain-containing protein n=1 Tax=Necator americanus TaxID=51031 RepID=A0ABR1CME6_NECAM
MPPLQCRATALDRYLSIGGNAFMLRHRVGELRLCCSPSSQTGALIFILIHLGEHSIKLVEKITSRNLVHKSSALNDEFLKIERNKNVTLALGSRSDEGEDGSAALPNPKKYSYYESGYFAYGLPELDAYIVTSIVDRAKEIVDESGSPVYFMMFSEAYKYLALNWLCNTAAFENSVEVIALEPDSIWFRDPNPMFRKMSSRQDIDAISPLSATGARIGIWRGYSPMLLKTSEATVALLRELLQKMQRRGRVDNLADYNYLCMTRHSGVICDNFLYEDVSDGKWFGLTDTDKNLLHPYILNNNNINGRKKKENRQKKFGLWFLSEEGHCNHQAVKRMLESFGKTM